MYSFSSVVRELGPGIYAYCLQHDGVCFYSLSHLYFVRLVFRLLIVGIAVLWQKQQIHSASTLPLMVCCMMAAPVTSVSAAPYSHLNNGNTTACLSALCNAPLFAKLMLTNPATGRQLLEPGLATLCGYPQLILHESS